MAPKNRPPTKGPPRIDRSNQINSMSKMMRQTTESKKKQQDISRNINSLMVKQFEEQKNLSKDKRSPLAESKDVKEITSSVNEILKKLGYVIDNLSQGTKKITMETARATKEAMAEYGRAVGQDISVNKQNIVAMAIAKSSPVLGYFTSKFFETTIFKRMAEKAGQKFHDIFSAVTDKFKIIFSRMFEGFKNFFHIGKKGRERGTEDKYRGGRIPAMQTGGYVEKGGLARLHAAEVVVPVEKFLKTIRDSFSSAKEDSKKMLDELRMLRYGLVGFMSEFKLKFVKAFMDFPLVRKMTGAFSTIFAIGKFFTYARGRYRRMLPTGGNPLSMITGTLALIFTQGMYKLDVIIHHLATLIKCVCGQEPILPSIGSPTTKAQDLGGVFRFLSGAFKSKGMKGRVKESTESIKEKAFGMSENATKRATEVKEKIMLMARNPEEAKSMIQEVYGKSTVKSKLSSMRDAREAQRDVEKMYGASSPKEKVQNVYANILKFISSPEQATAMISAAFGPAKARALDAQVKANEKVGGFRKGLKERGKEWKKNIKEGPSVYFAKKQEAIDQKIGVVAKNTKSIASGMRKWTKFFIKLPFKLAFAALITLPKTIWNMGNWLVKNVGGTLKDIFMFVIWPVLSTIPGLIMKGLSVPFKFLRDLGVGKLGAVIGRALLVVTSIITTISDIFSGIEKAKDWFTTTGKSEDISSGIGAALGGTGSGWDGFFRGAIKGIGFGLMAGGPVGAIIGGGLGGLLGYIGGERIAKFIEPAVSGIIEFCKLISSVFGGAIDWLKDQRKEIAEKGLFGWIATMISSTIGTVGSESIPTGPRGAGIRESIPGTTGPATSGAYDPYAQGDAYPTRGSKISSMGQNTEIAMIVRDSVLEGYSLVGKILKEELEDKQMMERGFSGAAKGAAATAGVAGINAATPPVTAPYKVKAAIAESDKNLPVTGASFLAGGTAALTDSLVNRLGKGVHLEGLNPDFASKFASMAKEYSDMNPGQKLRITDAFRSREEQARLFALKPHLAAPPGRSRHEKGIAIDMDSAQANQLYTSGLMEKHGFYRPMYPPWGGGPGKKSEPWHIEMAKGAQVGDAYPAVRMSKKDIARLQVGDAFAGANMMASAAGSSGDGLHGALTGFGKEMGNILINTTNIMSKAVSQVSSNKSGGGEQNDPMLQSILTGNFG